MQLTKQQKIEIIEMFKNVDVKKLDLDNQDQDKVHWFRFGSYTGMSLASEIIKAIPELEEAVS